MDVRRPILLGAITLMALTGCDSYDQPQPPQTLEAEVLKNSIPTPTNYVSEKPDDAQWSVNGISTPIVVWRSDKGPRKYCVNLVDTLREYGRKRDISTSRDADGWNLIMVNKSKAYESCANQVSRYTQTKGRTALPAYFGYDPKQGMRIEVIRFPTGSVPSEYTVVATPDAVPLVSTSGELETEHKGVPAVVVISYPLVESQEGLMGPASA